jgi:hypothetical protein
VDAEGGYGRRSRQRHCGEGIPSDVPTDRSLIVAGVDQGGSIRYDEEEVATVGLLCAVPRRWFQRSMTDACG